MRKFGEFELSGVIDLGDNPLDYHEFFDAFTEMVEARGWSWSCTWKGLDENGDPVPYDGHDKCAVCKSEKGTLECDNGDYICESCAQAMSDMAP